MAPTMHNILISVLAGVGSFRLDQQRSDDRPLAEVVPTPLSQTTITPAPTSAPVSSKALISALNLATNEEDRLSILVPDSSNISNITYHFVNNTVSPPTGGTIALSSVSSFPALLTTNVAMAIGFVNPCGLNAPHSHPRANEFLTVIQNELVTGLILESNPGSNGNVVGKAPVENANGTLPQAGTTLHLYQGTIYPQGSTHFQFNPTCEPSVFAAAFDNRDPGRVQIARNFFSLGPNEVIESAIGGDGSDGSVLDARNIDTLKSRIPGSYAILMEECAKRCGIVPKL